LHVCHARTRLVQKRPRSCRYKATAEIMPRVLILASDGKAPPSSAATKQDRSGAQIEPGASRLVQLRLETPVTALPGDRFIIRSYSPQVTIGGGTIIDALPEKHRVKSLAPSLLERLERVDPIERIAVFVEMAGPAGLSLGEIISRTGATGSQVARARATLVDSGRLVDLAGSPPALIASDAVQDLSERVIALLERHHQSE